MKTGRILLLALALGMTGCAQEPSPRAEPSSMLGVAPTTPATAPPATALASPATTTSATTIASAVASPAVPPAAAASAAPATSDVIPWADLPGTAYEPAPTVTTAPTMTAPPCRADQLTVADVQPPGDTADDGAIVDLRDTSTAACLLIGSVDATLYGPAAPDVGIVGDGVPADWKSHDMAPGEVTSVWFTANSVCMSGPPTGLAAVAVTSARLRIPGGGSVLVRGLNIPRTCGGPQVSGFYRHPADVTYLPAALSHATFSIDVTRTPVAGSTVHFVVTIANPGGSPISLSPCPSYRAMIPPYPDKSLHGLNCAGHTDIAAHHSLRFAMQMVVPPKTPPGPQKLEWVLDGPAVDTLPGSVAFVDVQASD